MPKTTKQIRQSLNFSSTVHLVKLPHISSYQLMDSVDSIMMMMMMMTTTTTKMIVEMMMMMTTMTMTVKL